ncbi:tetratricopeptide repeat protein [Thermogutta sp.]|uniref:tetratricopeptide repeat protein n=1 Tax=Thermogutta sp. TaxID=1962930 RepID=UPI003C79B507
MPKQFFGRTAFLWCALLTLSFYAVGRADGPSFPSGWQSLSEVPARAWHVLLVGSETGPSAAENTVEEFVEVKGTEGRVQRWRGRIVNFSGAGLILRFSDGTEKHFPVEKVVSYSPNTSSLCQQAMERLSEGAVSEALELFARARSVEPREWRQREIAAQIVRCYHALGDYVRAGEEFVDRLIALDPQSPFVWCAPLAWFSEETLALVEPRARDWLNSDVAWVQLLGASYLIDSPASAQAVKVLEGLRSSSDKTVALLASAQLWRRGWPSVQPEQLSQWENAIEELPDRLKAGPCYLLGLAWKQQKVFDRAMVWFLKPPLLWPENRRVAARCLWEAAELAGKLAATAPPGSADGTDYQYEHQALLKELVRTFPETPWAARAGGK